MLEPCGSKKYGTENRTETRFFQFLLPETGTGTGTVGTENFFNDKQEAIQI
jgi:hypothetical protein